MTYSQLSPDTIHEHITLFTAAPRKIYLGHIASVSVLLYLGSQSPSVPAWFLFLWAATEIVFTPLALGWLSNSYRKNPERWVSKQRWINLFDSLFLFVGLSWGTMMFVSLNPDNSVHFSMQMAIIAGASAASVKSLGLFPRSFVLYGVSFLGLVTVRLFSLGNEYVILGGLVLVFLIMLLGLAKDALLSIQRYIDIKNQNLELAKQYQDAAERADNANREKTRLLATASHDLRQPFHAIGLYLETLTGRGFSPQDETTIDRIKHSLDVMTRLFNSVLDVSLLDEGKVEVNKTNISLLQMVRGVVDDFHPIAKIAGASLDFTVPDIGVFCDPVLLRRMIQNLVSNAIKYGDGSPVTIFTTEGNNRVNLFVKDLGPGILSTDQKIIFEEFAQLDKALPAKSSKNMPDHQEKGLGLGLAIVKRLAQLQGISVTMTSNTTGTIFQLGGIPLSKIVPHGERAALQNLPGEAIADKLVMIIDDDEESLNATTDLLSHWGYKTITSTGNLDLLENHQPDFIICDFELANGQTGLELLQAARSLRNKQIPALIISGTSSIEVRKKIEKEGFNLIKKPVQPALLRSALLKAFTQTD